MEENNFNPHPPSEPEIPETSEIPKIPSFSNQEQPHYSAPPPPVYPQNYPPPYYGNQNYTSYPPNYPQYQNQYPMYYQISPYPPNYMPPPPQKTAPPPPPAEPIPMNRKIFTMCGVMAAMIFLLCMYCIISDVMHGALSGTSGDISPTVVLQMQEKPDLDPDDENVTADGEYTVHGVAELVKPSIVEVLVYDEAHSLNGKGSGIIASEDGYIITNAHVVQGNDFSVMLDDETEYTAQLIGSDNKTDLAILKINASGLTPAILGDSDKTYVGETVIAIGNPAGLTNSVTQGIVSAVNRQIRAQSSSFRMECIQTDAAISPGNSGGALVNMYGQVIGITSSKYASQYEATYEGLGFAITTKQALPIIQDLIKNGYVSGRYRIGIVFMPSAYAGEQFQNTFHEEIPEELKNALWITEISPDCDISNTDLKANDFILSMNGHSVSDYDSVLDALEGCQGGDTVTAHCARYEKGKIVYFDITFKLEEDTSGNY
ncbi:MAG: trypsin-like peptidase domain-containing protein [Oscillospiraceae bacterium]|nr:trypsin-like peptidase domain-containing protein [Oscillospiraceae bacterium]